MSRRLLVVLLVLLPAVVAAQAPPRVDWAKAEAETLTHFQALVRMDTSDPPGNERPAAEYLKRVLDAEGIPAQVFESAPNRLNVVARLKGSGRRRPVLLMGHTDVVTVDPSTWTFPPFEARRDGGYVYGRGTLDDKDNVVASLMTLILLKRSGVSLDRDVILLAEAGEEVNTRVGIQYMIAQHFGDIDAEYCFGEGGGGSRADGRTQYALAETAEKIPRAIALTATGIAGHGSTPRLDNSIVHLSAALAALGAWKPPVRLNDTTRAYFERLAAISRPEAAARYRAVLNPESPAAAAAVDYFARNEPSRASMLRNSLSPTMLQAGSQVNVIPAEARATIDVRLVPGEDPAAFLEAVRKIVNDPAVKVEYIPRDTRPAVPPSRLDSDGYKVLESTVARIYDTTLIPTMGTGATDMAYLREKGMQCYGFGPATDVEDGQKGFGAHSHDERVLESELHRFVRFTFDLTVGLAGAR
jgi:acetylornithine deacetylase/succinyl-diaminopimelate desuccinylase-like protein